MDAVAGTERVYARAVANHGRSGDYKDGSGKTIHSKWEKWNADFALGITPNENTLIEFSGGTGDGEARYADRGMDGSRFMRESYGFKFERDNIGTTVDKVELQLYYNYVDHVMDNYSLRTPPPPTMMMPNNKMKSNPTRKVYGGRTALTWDFGGGHTLISGFDAQFDEHRTEDGNAPGKNITYDKYGIFGELTTPVSEQSKFVSGLRFDSVRAEDFRPGTTKGDSREAVLSAGFLRFEQKFADPSIMWYAGIGYVERFPDFWELNQSKTGSNNDFNKLEPEKTAQFDVGIQYNGEKTQTWASAYAGLVRDYVLFNYSGHNTIDTAGNVDARIMGAEVGFSHFLIDRLKFSSSLAYAWGENTTDNAPLPQMPPLEGRLGLSYERDTWEVGLLWRLVAPQHRIAENQGNVKGRDFADSSGFSVVSLGGSYQPVENIKLSAGIDNIFDRTYSEHLNTAGVANWGYSGTERITEPGRTVWGRISIEF